MKEELMSEEKSFWGKTKEVTEDVWEGTKSVTEDLWEGTKNVAGSVKKAFTGDEKQTAKEDENNQEHLN